MLRRCDCYRRPTIKQLNRGVNHHAIVYVNVSSCPHPRLERRHANRSVGHFEGRGLFNGYE